ncbi:MAG: DUF6624 domain-containing protein [Chloroflexota bacterium]
MTQQLQHELITRAEKSRRLRESISQSYQRWKDILAVEQDNALWLKRIVRENGWIRQSVHGTEAAKAAWKIVYHSGDHVFMRQCLRMMEPMVQTGEACQKDYAFLMDRFLINQGRKQLYGTQSKKQDGQIVLLPIKDQHQLDERRQTVGLDPLLAIAE